MAKNPEINSELNRLIMTVSQESYDHSISDDSASTGSTVEKWSSKRAFLLAAIGGSVGLGNIWRFPYEAGENGGAAFVFVYLFFVVVISLPILICELALGRKTGLSAMNAIKAMSAQEGRGAGWRYTGWLMMLTLFLIASFYSVIGGWTLAYSVEALSGGFVGISATESKASFSSLLSSPLELSLWHGVFMVLCVAILSRGIKQGLEKVALWAMPLLLSLLVILVVCAIFMGDMMGAVKFLFSPDFSKLNPDVVFSALGQAFFSIGISMGFMITYGAYLPKNISIGQSASVIVAGDTLVALVAGLAIFPFVFQYGFDSSSGEGLVFETLPIVFGQMPGGTFLGVAFFLLLTLAALTSQIANLEPLIAATSETLGVGRKLSAGIVGVSSFLVGLGTVVSFNIASDVKIFGETFFGFSDMVVTQITMPLAGLMTLLFIGWFVRRSVIEEALEKDSHWFSVWYFLVRYVCPMAVASILIYQFVK